MEDYMEKIRKTYQVTIKDTKDKMKNMLVKNQNIKSHTYDFRSLYENYYQSEGFISPALCFLTVLHLAN
jgi:5-hydroxyisourate hydrolase-like protein (transthyretin family)